MRLGRRRLRWWFWAAIGGLTLVTLVALPGPRRALMNSLPSRAFVELGALRGDFSVDHALRIEMPDHVQLAGSLYLPNDRSEPLATVLVRSPYGRLAFMESYQAGVFFARHGYAVLVQDLRGTGDSGGELRPWKDVEADGSATLDWIARQPWSNGKVGTFGCSALGETQLVLARRNHPAHAALIASGAGGAIGSLRGRYGYFGLFEGGVFQLSSGFGWFADNGSTQPRPPPTPPFDTAAALRRLPVSDLVRAVRNAPTSYEDFLAMPPGDPRWSEWGYLTDADRLSMPALIINTWNDQTVADSLEIAQHIAEAGDPAARNLRVMIAPGNHCSHETSQPEPEFASLRGRGGALPIEDWYLAWFDYWLRGRGAGLAALPNYQYFMLGENRWYDAHRWPPEHSIVQRWYLGGEGHANSRSGDGRLSLSNPAIEAADAFSYDPGNPVPSRGGPICCTGNPEERRGATDQSDVERRNDVLVYTSEPLDRDLRIAGPVRARLTFSSNVPDTDLVARLVDVSPEGVAMNVQEGALRLRYRDGPPARLMNPGERYTVVVDMRAIAWRIARGHRVRLQVTSSSFPRLERNLNTGGDNHHESRYRTAANRVHHGAAVESFVEFPVLPDDQDFGITSPGTGL